MDRRDCIYSTRTSYTSLRWYILSWFVDGFWESNTSSPRTLSISCKPSSHSPPSPPSGKATSTASSVFLELFRTLCHLLRHCILDRPGTSAAISPQFLPPCVCTAFFSLLSSSSDHLPCVHSLGRCWDPRPPSPPSGKATSAAASLFLGLRRKLCHLPRH
jgi:hypothetical protein